MCLCNEANISQKTIQKFIVYGELMCNKIYDYKERDLVGKWKVFWCYDNCKERNN